MSFIQTNKQAKMNKVINFSGPYSFLKGDNSLFNSEFTQDEGIYLWVIKDTKHNINYIHYVGETIRFAKRQREHIINILGLNYYIIDADFARQGEHKILWNGMWRDRTNNAPGNAIDIYDSLSKDVEKYLSCIDIYFAPTDFSRNIRRHVEGSIGWNLRNNHYDLTVFYPDDNHIGTMKESLNEIIDINSSEPIAGLDNKIKI
jgi:hypothetical protein